MIASNLVFSFSGRVGVKTKPQNYMSPPCAESQGRITNMLGDARGQVLGHPPT